MTILEKKLEIAAIHAERLKRICQKLASFFPLKPQDVEKMDETRVAQIDHMVYRFAQLQDLMGQYIFTSFLERMGEPVNELFYIDKLNRMEKIGILPSAEEWKQMRDLRNLVTHEYPGHIELMAENLNKTYEFIPKLLLVFERLVAAVFRIKK